MNTTRLVRSFIAVAAVALTAMTVARAPQAAARPLYPAADPDRFYQQPGKPVLAKHRNGDVLRSRMVPAIGFPGATAWQLQYRSENSQGKPIAAVTTLLLPSSGGRNRPLVSYQPFINSLGLRCAPSHTLFGGLQEGPALNAFLARGWAVAVPDHLGPTSAYGAAKLGGRLVLDGIRAVKRFAPSGLAGSPVGMAGYSGGGMATGWAAALAPTYAPELNIVGAAQGGVPVDMGQLALDVGLAPSPMFGLGFAAAMGLEREYPKTMHLADYLNDFGKGLRVRIANSCVDDILAAGANMSLFNIRKAGVFDVDPDTRKVLYENSLGLYPGIPRAPMYEWHGSSDIVSVPLAMHLAGRYCHRGTRELFEVIPGLDHGSAIIPGTIRAFTYLSDRFAGIPAPSNCL